jgi:hypothetical protein
MDAWILRQERLHFLALVNWRFIPDQHDRAVYMSKQMLHEVNDLLPRQVAAVRLGPQSDPASSRCDQQCPNGVDMLIVLNTGSNPGCLPARCPSAFDRTDQRLSVFVNEYQGCSQVMPLFLSWAIRTASNEQAPDHHVERQHAVASGNSSACAVTDARLHWACSVHRIVSRSNRPCEPMSSNPQHNRRHARFGGAIASAAQFAVVKRRGRPGDLRLRGRSVRGCCASRRQRWILRSVMPIASANSAGVWPRCKSRRTRSRRVASCWTVPIGLMPYIMPHICE